MNKSRFTYLLSNYLNNSFTEAELEEFLDLLENSDAKDIDQFVDHALKEKLETIPASNNGFEKDSTFLSIKNHITNDSTKEIKKETSFDWRRVAASIALIVSIGLFWMYSNQSQKLAEYAQQEDIQLPDAIAPTVTLENGTNYSLLNMESTALLELGMSLTTTASGEVAFEILPTYDGLAEQRTFHVPKGTSSILLMPDGTKVWLNSGAKLQYPSQFEKNTRQVTLEGEAYFEVAHNAASPFIVHSGETHIKVLGTSFNVASELDSDKTFTTLVSGKVEVNTNKDKVNLEPGLQSITSKSLSKIETRQVNTQDIIAWRDGYFNFEDDDIKTVLAKIKSWYDIQDYEVYNETSDHFTGSILRTHKLSHLLDQLEKTSNYKFKIKEGRVQAIGNE